MRINKEQLRAGLLYRTPEGTTCIYLGIHQGQSTPMNLYYNIWDIIENRYVVVPDKMMFGDEVQEILFMPE